MGKGSALLRGLPPWSGPGPASHHALVVLQGSCVVMFNGQFDEGFSGLCEVMAFFVGCAQFPEGAGGKIEISHVLLLLA